MGEFTQILKSFSLQATLNPKIWESPDNVDDSKMKSKVREALMKIAEKFIDYLGDDVFVEDITLTGSLANYNWSEFSDFDLHIIIDFQQYEKEAEVYQELFDARKYIFNENHNIKIYGYDVELYAQDVEEKHTSTGLYSVMSDEWLQKPKKQSPDVDKKLLVQKIDCWIEKIEKGIKEDKDLDKLKEKLKEYRKSGLEKEGELSYENLVFKFLRRSGHIEKLFDEINKRTDKELSIENKVLEEQKEEGFLSKLISSISDSTIMKSLKLLGNSSKKFEMTPGIKTPYDENVAFIQNSLEFLGYKSEKWGIDGKYGPETKKAVEKFQEDNNLTKDGVMKSDDIKTLLALLLIKNFTDSKAPQKPTDFGKEGNFTYLDLDSSEGVRVYAEICQKFIDRRNPNAGVDGQMMAECAKRFFSQGYVPPELALAQLALEGGLSKNETVRPRRTKNPFNVGNTDSGKNKFFSTVKEGVCAYYDLMVRRYLTSGKKAEDLLRNFVNDKGYRYASGGYEPKLKELVASASKISEPILTKVGISMSTMG